MDLHSERLEAKLNAVDWAVRDVLVGTVRSPQQLDICRRHRFYYIPAEQLGDEAFSVRIVALYQSQYVFGPQAGVQYYGEVTKCSPVCRGDITELRARKGTEQNLYYRFEIREWKRLNRPIAARESCFVKGLTSRFQLEHSAETPELWLRSQEEYRLYLNLRQARRHLHQRGGQRPWLCVPGFRGALRGRKDPCFGQGMGLRAVRDRRFPSKCGGRAPEAVQGVRPEGFHE